MVAVFCEDGGHVLLGKAREVADEIGDRVIALTLRNGAKSPDELISLGADEVVEFQFPETEGWSSGLSEFIKSESSLNLIVFPLSANSSLLMGSISAGATDRISVYLEDAQILAVGEFGKRLGSSLLVQKRSSDGKVQLISLNVGSVAEPFEDSSRYGKTRSFRIESQNGRLPSLPEIHPDSQSLTVLLDLAVAKETAELARKLAEKYHGAISRVSGRIEVIYGPCVAVEVFSKIRDLPEFKGELISLSSRNVPINSMAEVSYVTPEINRFLSALIG